MTTSSAYLVLWWLISMIVLLGSNEVSGECLEYQKILLIKLNRSLISEKYTNVENLRKRARWDSNEDCCGWPGVACSNDGYVTGLDLSYERIEQGLNNSSPLFDLQYLTSLNLAHNRFQWRVGMSSGFERLVNLMDLNMSYLIFLGRFPIEISNLTRLVTLDLSFSFNEGSSDSYFNLRTLIGNMSKLTQLRLDYVKKLGVQGNEWSQVVSFSLPHLQVLSLRSCGLAGPIPILLRTLTSLTYLDLSYNWNLSGNIPDSLSELKMLSILKFRSCNLQGSIPNSLTNLINLTYLDLSYNKLSGTIPILSRFENLTFLGLGYNQLTGSILGTNWSELSQLVYIDFQDNSLSGSIPVSLFGIPTLQQLYLASNQFAYFTIEPVNTSLSRLEVLELGYNELQGSFPSFVFGLQALRFLNVHSNSFSDMFYMDSLQRLRNLSTLILSYNNFSVSLGDELQNFPDSFRLEMASCKLKAFPTFLKKNTRYRKLDLSANQIEGEIPHWIWNILEFESHLNLSHNQLQTFESLEGHFDDCEASVVDLNSNKLHGKTPKFSRASYLDLSYNLFDSTIYSSINISALYFLSISNNRLQGSFFKSLCNATLSVLDLSNNFLSDVLPTCLAQMPYLAILNLKKNNISGTIPDSFPYGCGLQTVILNGNSLLGSIPKSLGKCTRLKVFDMGNNKLHDGFPCWMSSILTLGVLVLNSNMFEGSIICPGINVTWPSLQILDLSSNNFSGNLPSQQLMGWNSMIADEESNSQDNNIDYSPIGSNYGYKVIVTLTVKGIEVILPKISAIFTLIDLSDNTFKGIIPDEFGYFNALRSLNISYNGLRGHIPSSLGKMKNLESLDLQKNELNGKIPVELANLNFLSVLNLSFNQLEGMIPNGGQLQTFTEYSFMHNKFLCGFPLSTSCANEEEVKPLPNPLSEVKGSALISAEVGYAVGLGLVIMPLIFWTRWRIRFYDITDRILLKILCRRPQRTHTGS